MNIYRYGMKYRPFSIGCQPLENLIEAQEDATGVYYNILLYSEKLTQDQITSYQLTDLQPQPDIKQLLTNLYKALNRDFLRELDIYARTESGKPLIVLIRSYADATKEDPQPDFIEYIKDLQTNNSISAMQDYYEIIDFMQEETTCTN